MSMEGRVGTAGLYIVEKMLMGLHLPKLCNSRWLCMNKPKEPSLSSLKC